MQDLKAQIILLWKNLAIRALILSLPVIFLLAAIVRFSPVSLERSASLSQPLGSNATQLRDLLLEPRIYTGTAITKAPVFHESRSAKKQIRQEIVAPAPARQLSAKELYKLTGVINTISGSRVAYIEIKATGETRRLSTGDIVGDWQVSEIASDYIILQFDERSERVPIG